MKVNVLEGLKLILINRETLVIGNKWFNGNTGRVFTCIAIKFSSVNPF